MISRISIPVYDVALLEMHSMSVKAVMVFSQRLRRCVGKRHLPGWKVYGEDRNIEEIDEREYKHSYLDSHHKLQHTAPFAVVVVIVT